MNLFPAEILEEILVELFKEIHVVLLQNLQAELHE